VWEKFRRAEG